MVRVEALTKGTATATASQLPTATASISATDGTATATVTSSLGTASASLSTSGASATATAFVAASPPQPPTSVNPVAVTDGYSDDEEARIFDADEVESDEEDVAFIRQRRRRGCVADCACEKARGRKCICEKIGDGQCDDKCGCDKAKCRAFVQGDESAEEAA